MKTSWQIPPLFTEKRMLEIKIHIYVLIEYGDLLLFRFIIISLNFYFNSILFSDYISF